MLLVRKEPPDDELVCSIHVEDSIFETNKGIKCIYFWSYI
jgi:hypothetical protein